MHNKVTSNGIAMEMNNARCLNNYLTKQTNFTNIDSILGGIDFLFLLCSHFVASYKQYRVSLVKLFEYCNQNSVIEEYSLCSVEMCVNIV